MKNETITTLVDLEISLNRILRNPLSYVNYQQYNEGYHVALKPEVQTQVDQVNGAIARLEASIEVDP
jgi:hypothetical protein